MKKLILIVGIVAMSAFPISITASNVSYDAEISYAEGQTSSDPASIATKTEEKEWEKIIKEYLGPDKVAMYMSWVAYIGTIIGLVVNIKKLAKSKNLTMQELLAEIRKALVEIGDENSKKLLAQLDKVIPSILTTQEKTNDVLKIFAKILALAQENTPESRIAILKLIEELGTIGKEVTEAVQSAIEEEVHEEEEKGKQIEERLNTIIGEYDGTTI